MTRALGHFPSVTRDTALRVLAWFVAAIALSQSLGCSMNKQSPPAPRTPRVAGEAAPRPAAINHLAFFKLHNPADAAELIADCDRHLGTLPMVVSYFCGQHLDTGRGDRIDSDYDVGFFVGFADAAAYSAYVDHPEHKALVAKWQPRWEWIRVIDVLDETP